MGFATVAALCAWAWARRALAGDETPPLTPEERQALRDEGLEKMNEAVRNAARTSGWTAYAPEP